MKETSADTSLSPNITRSKYILFLGAGASAPLGFPVMGDFMDRVGDVLPMNLRALLANIDRQYSTDDRRGRDLEVVLNALATYRDHFAFMQKDPILRGPLPQLEQVRSDVESLDKVVRDHIFEEYGRPPDGVSTLYSPLVELFTRELQQEMLPVFTTNYDTCVETFADTKPELNLEFGFEPGLATSMWAPDRFEKLAPETGPTIALFKLHGSVTWYGTPQGIRHIQIWRRGIEAHENLIIYPGTSKVEVSDEPFRTCYAYLRDCLLRARCVVVIGYSFRDAALQAIFNDAARVNSRLKFVIINGKLGASQRETIKSQLGAECFFIPELLEAGSPPSYRGPLRSVLLESIE